MDARDEVKSRISIEDVIGRYLELKKSGRNYKALSPFTKEKTASFIVSPEKQIWHDFSSGRGGDVFSFVMEVEGLDFRSALELLARRAGVDLEKYDKPGKTKISKSRLYDLNEIAAKFYQVQLKANKLAFNYLFKDRKLSKETVLHWQIGYSPNTGSALYSFLKNKGYVDAEIQAAGLVSKRGARLVDMFRGRLMIPLADGQGRIIGFTARTIKEDDYGPKYINTPQTILYDKSRHIFGLHFAKDSIRVNGFVVVVEGNFDVIASHQAGIKQVIATAGTALTEQHLKSLSLITNDIRLCFDADRAGLSATERAISLASKHDINISVITIPKGKDPDELTRTDPDSWKETISQPIYAVDWLIDFYKSQVDLNSAPGKRRFSNLVLPIIRSLSDEVEKDHYINLLSQIMNIRTISLSNKIEGLKEEKQTTKLPIKVNDYQIDKGAIEEQKIQDNFLSIMLVQPRLRNNLELLSKEMFKTHDSLELFNFLVNQPNINIEKDISIFKDIIDYVKIELLLYEELYQGLEISDLSREAIHLKSRLVESYIKNKKKKITNKLMNADSLETRKLLEHVKMLDNLLNQTREEGGINAQETTN